MSVQYVYLHSSGYKLEQGPCFTQRIFDWSEFVNNEQETRHVAFSYYKDTATPILRSLWTSFGDESEYKIYI